MSRIWEETNDRYTLGVTGPGVYARLGDEGLLGPRLGGEMWRVGQGGMHIGPALVIGHRLAVEDGGLVANTTALWFCLFLDDGGLWFLVVLCLLCGVFLDAVEKGGLFFTLPCSPWADVSAVAVDDVEVALVLSLAFEVPFLGISGAHGVYSGKSILTSAVEGAEDRWSVWVDGGVEGVSEDGMCEMLCFEGMVGHGLLLNVSGQRVLVEEAVAVSKGILGALYGQCHVVVGDVYIDLSVGGTGDKRGVAEGVLGGEVSQVRGRGDGAYLMQDMRRRIY